MTTQFAPIWDDAAVAFTTIKANATDTASAAATTLLDLQVNNVSKFVVDKFGELIITPTARTSGSDSLISLIAPADTTRAASTEATDINFNLARTVQFAAGNITDQRAIRIQAPTYSFASASTITNASTLSISGPPVAGTNATITNPFSLNVESGAVKFSGQHLMLSSARIYLWNSASYYFEQNNSLAGFPISNNHVQIALDNATGFFCNQAVDSAFGWSDNLNNAKRTRICRDADHVIALRNSTNAYTFRNYNTYTDSSNYERLAFQFGTFSSVRHAQIAAESAGTGTANINLVLTPRGAGAFILGPPPDGTATGGNTRGSGAVDLSTTHSDATQVASGTGATLVGYGRASGAYSFAGAGGQATGNSAFAFGIGTAGTGGVIFNSPYSAAGSYAFAICGDFLQVTGTRAFGHGGIPGLGGATVAGQESAGICGGGTTTTALAAFAHGYCAVARYPGQRAFALWGHGSGYEQIGSTQGMEFLVRAKTTDGITPVILNFYQPSQRITIPSGKGLSALIILKGFKADGSVGARFTRMVDIKNVGGTTSLETTPETYGTDYNPSECIYTITADNTNKALQLAVTGVAGETWRWVAVVYGVELAYGT